MAKLCLKWKTELASLIKMETRRQPASIGIGLTRIQNNAEPVFVIVIYRSRPCWGLDDYMHLFPIHRTQTVWKVPTCAKLFSNCLPCRPIRHRQNFVMKSIPDDSACFVDNSSNGRNSDPKIQGLWRIGISCCEKPEKWHESQVKTEQVIYNNLSVFAVTILFGYWSIIMEQTIWTFHAKYTLWTC